jgi:hypothetical protein
VGGEEMRGVRHDVGECQDCKWWGVKVLGGWIVAKDGHTYAECEKMNGWSPSHIDHISEVPVETRADFGCVLWEARE